MNPDHDALLAWALTRLERPVDDPAGLFVDLVESPGEGAGPSPDRGSVVILVEDGQPVPLLADAIPHAIQRARLVLIVVRGPSHRWALEPHSVLEAADRVGAGILDLRRFQTGWGMVLVNRSEEGDWRHLALSAAGSADELVRQLDESRAEVADLHRRLAGMAEEQRSLLVDLDEGRVRSAAVEQELRDLRGSRRRLEAQLSDLVAERSANRIELEGLRGKLADLSRLQNELERHRADASALRRRRAALEQRQEGLLDERAKLRHLLAVEKWKRRSLTNRRWWRLGRLVAGIVRRPWAVGTHWSAVADLFRSIEAEPRPQMERTHHAGGRPASPISSPVPESELPAAVADREPRSVDDPKELVVAAILDDMSVASFAPECRLVTFTPDNWRLVLERADPDFLFVESAWKGNSGSWEYQVGSYSHPESIGLPRLTELVDWCRSQGIPTVFWNKEDPIHFDKFKEAAQLFDFIFTTDSDRLAGYRSLPRSRARSVAALPFAAQPKLHYPAPLEGRQPVPVFAGTFYRNRHPERRDQLEMLLDGAMEDGLVIYDRMNGQVTESFGYPERFRPAIVGGVPYDEMVGLYRRHRVFLNTNSVITSPTMFSRRVFELLASATPVVSTPSRGVSEMFGGDVIVVSTAEEVSKELDRLLRDDRYWLDVSRKGFLSVARRHLYGDRLRQVAELVGFRFPERNQVEVVAAGLDARPWEGGEPAPEYVVFGNDETLGWPGRIVEADIVGYTDDPRLAYQWSQHLPDGEIGVRRTLLEDGWAPGDELPARARVFLIPG